MTGSVPNMLTWSRIVLAPVIMVLYFLGKWGALAALVLFIAAGITDWLDGKIARENNEVNRFGAFLDPVADKVLVVCVLMALVADPSPPVSRLLLAALATLVIVREVTQSALRDWMGRSGKADEVAVTPLSKTKTALQLVALGILLGHGTAELVIGEYEFGPALIAFVTWTGVAMLAAAAALGLTTLAGFIGKSFAGKA